MRLSAKPIVNYTDINHFSYVNQWIVSAGDPNVLYFQLVDLDQGPGCDSISQSDWPTAPAAERKMWPGIIGTCPRGLHVRELWLS